MSSGLPRLLAAAATRYAIKPLRAFAMRDLELKCSIKDTRECREHDVWLNRR